MKRKVYDGEKNLLLRFCVDRVGGVLRHLSLQPQSRISRFFMGQIAKNRTAGKSRMHDRLKIEHII